MVIVRPKPVSGYYPRFGILRVMRLGSWRMTVELGTTSVVGFRRTRRLARWRRSRHHVPSASYGMDQRSIEALVDFASQPIDVNFNDIRFALPIGLPKLVVKHLSRKHFVFMPHEELQQRDFRRR